MGKVEVKKINDTTYIVEIKEKKTVSFKAEETEIRKFDEIARRLGYSRSEMLKIFVNAVVHQPIDENGLNISISIPRRKPVETF